VNKLALAVLVVTSSCSLPSRAGAEEGSARRYNAEARALFNLGKFEQAEKQYELAYEASPLPVFLYNLGQCQMRRGGLTQLKRAVHSFKSYLHGAPAARNREAVLKQINKLERQIARIGRERSVDPQRMRMRETGAGSTTRPTSPRLDSRPAPRPAPRPASLPAPSLGLQAGQDQPGPARPTSSRPLYAKWWFWTIVGAALTAGGIALAVGTSSDPRVPAGHEVRWSEFQLGWRH
jgi:tetratricopeptide (TPR) repeat protein